MSAFCLAQEGTTIAPPASPDSAPQVVEATTQTVAPTADAAPAATSVVTQESVVPQTVTEAPADIAPAAGTELIVNEGTSVQAAPIQDSTLIQGTPIYSDGQVLNSGQIVEGQAYPEMASPAPFYGESVGQSVLASPVMDQSIVAAPVAAAPITTAPAVASQVVADPFTSTAVVADSVPCANCQPNGRRQVVRTVTTRGRSVLTRVRNITRVRGLLGRLR